MPTIIQQTGGGHLVIPDLEPDPTPQSRQPKAPERPEAGAPLAVKYAHYLRELADKDTRVSLNRQFYAVLGEIAATIDSLRHASRSLSAVAEVYMGHALHTGTSNKTSYRTTVPAATAALTRGRPTRLRRQPAIRALA